MNSAIKTNILFFQNSVLPAHGGVPRVSDIVSKELTKRGYQCFFIFHDIDNEDYPPHIKLKLDLNSSYGEIEKCVLQFIAKNKINTFICQNAYSSTFINIYKRIRLLYPDYPFFCFLHASPDYWQNTYALKSDTLNHKFFKNRIKKLLKKIIYPIYNPYVKSISSLYALSNKFILLSDSFKESFVKIYPVNDYGNKLLTIPNPLTFYEYIDSRELNSKDKIVIIVSRLEETQKKIYVALKIWEQVTKVNSDWKLFIIGSGPDEGFYKKYVQTHHLQEVSFFGQINNVIEYYKQASLLMMTSVWEGLPMSLLEAQQNGVVPMVFDNFSAVHDIISNGRNGYIIQNNNTEEFATRLENLMQDDALRHKMASEAVEQSKRFQITTIVDKWEKMLIQKFDK